MQLRVLNAGEEDDLDFNSDAVSLVVQEVQLPVFGMETVDY